MDSYSYLRVALSLMVTLDYLILLIIGVLSVELTGMAYGCCKVSGLSSLSRLVPPGVPSAATVPGWIFDPGGEGVNDEIQIGLTYCSRWLCTRSSAVPM